MRRTGWLLALGLACGAGLLGLWLSRPSRADEAPAIGLLTREVSLGKPGPGMVAKKVVVSSDSRHVAYVVGRGDKGVRRPNNMPIVGPDVKVVADGVEGKEYKQISDLVFSPDSRHMAYLAERGGKWFAVVDGVEGREYEGFLPGSRLVFDSPSQLHALAVRGDEFFRAEMDIVGALESK